MARVTNARRREPGGSDPMQRSLTNCVHSYYWAIAFDIPPPPPLPVEEQWNSLGVRAKIHGFPRGQDKKYRNWNSSGVKTFSADFFRGKKRPVLDRGGGCRDAKYWSMVVGTSNYSKKTKVSPIIINSHSFMLSKSLSNQKLRTASVTDWLKSAQTNVNFLEVVTHLVPLLKHITTLKLVGLQ